MKTTRSLLIALALLSVSLLSSSHTSLAQSNPVRARVTQPVDMLNLVTLQGNVHPLARPEFDQGVAPDDLTLERALLVLQRGSDQETALRQLLDDQQVKSSARFHQWLTPEEFGQQFGPADSDIQAVTSWLASQGFVVTKVAAGRTVIEFSGTAGLVRQVLGTEIHRFRVNGEDRWANISDPQIPTALAPVVAGFASLNNFPRKPMSRSLGSFTRSRLTGRVQPLFTFDITCSTNYTDNCLYFALGPTDFATIYNVLPLWNASIPTDGTGQTIAVVGETNINPQDVADFRSMFGLPANAPNIILNGPDPGITKYDETEADLDVEWSGAVAKGATIDLVVSESTETTLGIDLSALYIVDNNLAPVMSESYGGCEASLGAGGNQFYSTLWEQAAAQGITVLTSAGDSGSAGCDSVNEGETEALYGLAVSGLASTPFNVAVGGTDFNVTSSNEFTYWNPENNSSQGSAKSYIPEIPWNDSCAASGSLTGCTPPPNTTYLDDGFYLEAGSGGPSSCTNPSGIFPNVTCSGNYSKPSWQSGAGVPNDGARDIPDLSLFAGNGFHGSFYVICQMDANASDGGNSNSCDLNFSYTDFQGGSGTSASVQAFAGVMAMANQRYGRQGNANYVLYPMAAQSGSTCNSRTAPVTNSSCIFYDVTTGNNSVICQGGSPNCSSTTSGQYGIVVSGGAAAYPATTGYDFATGLGSVNVANLVNNWTSNFTLSTTSLSLSTTPATNPITLTHGQPINFSVNVGSSSGTPTGDVSLIAQTGSSSSNATGIGPFTLSGATVSGSTNMLPGGSYNVIAHYAGNGTLAASDSSPGIPVTVGKESSLTELRLATPNATGSPVYNVTTVPYGSIYILRMDVTNSSGQLCANQNTGLISYPCPTGALTVTPAPTDQNPPPGTVPGQYKLSSQGYAEDQPIQQLPGTYNFVANYSGDNSYTPSVSTVVPITITKAPTTTTLTGVPSSAIGAGVIYAASPTVTVNTQSSGVAPSGTAQLLLNGSTVLGATTVVAGFPALATGYAYSQAYLIDPTLPAGPATLTAEYLGDSNYAGSTSAPASITIMDFGVSVNPTSLSLSAPGQSGTVTLTITPLYGFTGTVSVSCMLPGSPIGSNPLGISCAPSTSSYNVTGPSPVTATLTISTAGGSSAAPPVPLRRAPPRFHEQVAYPWQLAGLLALASLLCLATARRRPAAWLFATAVLLAGFWVACGGSAGGGGQGNGSSAAPATSASFSPANLAFGQQGEGSTSASLSTLLTNTGNASLGISSISMGGPNPGDFSESNNCVSSLAPSANCTFTVTFTPSALGSRSAGLTVTDNAGSSPQTVTLTGTGVSAPTVKLSPASLAFGQVGVGVTSVNSVTLSNTGAAVLNVSSITVGNVSSLPQIPYRESDNCAGNPVPVGLTCTIYVTYEPSATGLDTASLLITDNAPGSPQMFSLSGTGVTPPGNYTFSVKAGIGTDTHTVPLTVTVQ